MLLYRGTLHRVDTVLFLSLRVFQHLYPVMANRIETDDLRGLNKGCSLKFCVDSRFQQTPEEG